MTLEAIAREIPIPVDAFGVARAYCTVERGAYRVVFGLDGGRRHSEPVGPAFAKPRDAAALARLLNGEAPAPRSAPAPTAAPISADVSRAIDGASAPELSGQPVPGPHLAEPEAPVRSCAVCGRDLPPGSRPQRRTCSTACRIRLTRAHGAGRPATNAGRADTDSAETVSAPPRASEAFAPQPAAVCGRERARRA